MSLTQYPDDPRLWKARIYPAGRKKDPKTGKPSNKRETYYYEGDKASALAWYQDLLRKAGGKKVPVLAPAIHEAYKDFLVYYKNKTSERTYSDFVLTYERHLKGYFGQYRPNLLSTAMIEGYKRKRLSEPYLPGKPSQKPEDDTPEQSAKRRPVTKRTIQKELNYLAAFLRWMTDPENNLAAPLQFKINNYKASQVTPPTLEIPSRKEMILILRSCKGDDRKYRPLLAVAYYAGLRRTELFTLIGQQVDFSAGYLRIKGKGNKNRTVPIVRKLRPYLRCVKKSGLLFTNEEGRAWESVDRLLVRSCKAVGMNLIYLHMFRHAFAVHAIQRGVALRTLQIVMGHSSIKTTERYLHLVPADLASDLDKPARRTAPRKVA